MELTISVLSSANSTMTVSVVISPSRRDFSQIAVTQMTNNQSDSEIVRFGQVLRRTAKIASQPRQFQGC
jgi:hypothetical protein